jgi:hypothetical protein
LSMRVFPCRCGEEKTPTEAVGFPSACPAVGYTALTTTRLGLAGDRLLPA